MPGLYPTPKYNNGDIVILQDKRITHANRFYKDRDKLQYGDLCVIHNYMIIGQKVVYDIKSLENRDVELLPATALYEVAEEHLLEVTKETIFEFIAVQTAKDLWKYKDILKLVSIIGHHSKCVINESVIKEFIKTLLEHLIKKEITANESSSVRGKEI